MVTSEKVDIWEIEMEAYQNQDWKKIVRKYSTPDPKRSWGQVLNTLTPYKKWAREHAAHHNTSGDLDKRGQGDVWTITTEEYCEINLFEKNSYHLFSHSRHDLYFMSGQCRKKSD